MIGRIAGQVVHRGLDHIIIDVHGVGYVIYVSDRVLAGLPGPGQPAALWTELLVREDVLQLFGFPTLVEKEWHRLLISVQGIGAKAALAILGALGPDALGRAIALGDWAAVAVAKGVGPKTAHRVINELKDKAPAVMALNAEAPLTPDVASLVEPDTAEPAKKKPASGAKAAALAESLAKSEAQSEALSALTNLGYGPGDAASAVATAIDALPEVTTSALIRAALQLLAPKD
ncbi:MAG: Holliday junction branch migration protein RuvA [Rhodobacteraceae bacterium]|nr:Holliday junction branch migration protein RuvA [Paracoccaceae bacterium]